MREIQKPAMEMRYEVASPIWTEEEAQTLVTDLLTHLENVNPLRQVSSSVEFDKALDLEGYPLLATLSYTPPQYTGGFAPYKDETFFEAQFLPNGEVRIKQSPLTLYLRPNNRDYPERDFSTRLSFELQFGNGEKTAGVLESEDNGDCDTSMTGDPDLENVLLPSNPKLIAATQVVFNR